MRCGGSQLPAARRRQNWEDVAWFLSHYRIGAGHQMFPSKPRKLPMSAQGCGNWGSTAGWADPMAAVLIRSVFPAGGAGVRAGHSGLGTDRRRNATSIPFLGLDSLVRKVGTVVTCLLGVGGCEGTG